MFERIMKERAVELIGEGHRFSDLRRWGLAVQYLNNRQEKDFYWRSSFHTQVYRQGLFMAYPQ